MTLEEKKMEFVVFCIENVAEQLNELPENIYSRLNNLGLDRKSTRLNSSHIH